MMQWPSLLPVLLFIIASSTGLLNVHAQIHPGHQDAISETPVAADHQGGHTSERWEGSSEGKAFSEFAHHFAGILDVMFGLAELGSALQYPVLYWTRFILPAALSIVGVFTFIWSDHDAWPIGSLNFVETFFGDDREIIEHKSYAILILATAFFEMVRRTGTARHPAFAAPLVVLVIASALSLFIHSHGNHPEATKIQFHHSMMGAVGLVAGFSKGLASWLPDASRQTRERWEMVWGGSIILFGLLLLVYSE